MTFTRAGYGLLRRFNEGSRPPFRWSAKVRLRNPGSDTGAARETPLSMPRVLFTRNSNVSVVQQTDPAQRKRISDLLGRVGRCNHSARSRKVFKRRVVTVGLLLLDARRAR